MRIICFHYALDVYKRQGLTSQPALSSVVAAIQRTERESSINLDDIQKISNYWEDVRPVYGQFESGLKAGTTEIYKYEIPGGQYSNLKPCLLYTSLLPHLIFSILYNGMN